MISISPSAIKEIKRVQSQRATSQSSFSVNLSVKSGGCFGLFYDLALDRNPAINGKYEVLEIEGINLLVDAESLHYFENLTLDYSEDLMGGGFRFHNPPVKDVCGCGISFRNP